MKINGSALLEQRASWLAIVHLSRRDDLLITPAKEEYGIDLLVSLAPEGKISGRVFGVMVKASRFLSVKAGGVEKNQFKLPVSVPVIPADLPFPLAFFVFNMEDDEGYFRWLLSPANASNLSLNHEPLFTQLSTASIDQAIAQVNRWYELRVRQPIIAGADLVTV